MVSNVSNALEQSEVFIESFSSPTPALFVDRDGVLIEDCHHLSDPDGVRLCSGAARFVRSACENCWPVIVVTNQSGISRGYFKWFHVKQVHSRMRELLGSNAPLAAIYSNGYGPNVIEGSWRKPSPNMLFEASKALNLDLKRSIMIGDRLSDLQAGTAADVAVLCHVLTGHGFNSRNSILSWHRQTADILLATPPSDHGVPCLKLLDSLADFPIQLLT